ncbi:hypothetical protein [Nonomuraea aridisoli]|nr:hypothetical protein [Nonomuraea aridisoli]
MWQRIIDIDRELFMHAVAQAISAHTPTIVPIPPGRLQEVSA